MTKEVLEEQFRNIGKSFFNQIKQKENRFETDKFKEAIINQITDYKYRCLGAFYYDYKSKKIFFSLDFAIVNKYLAPAHLIFQTVDGELFTNPYLYKILSKHPYFQWVQCGEFRQLKPIRQEIL